jgi:hypothetical protein
MNGRHVLLASIASCLVTVAAYAQWPEVKTPDIPRLANGKPDLSAPPLRTADGHPDLSGVWDVGNMTYFHDLAKGTKPGEVQLTPWAAAVQKQRRDRNHVDDPYGYCLPLGVPRIDTRSPFKILQTPKLTVMLHESYVGMIFRQVFTDGRPLPKLEEVDPTWLGYSIGRWEGDMFVVESIGFRDRGWLSAERAYPNSDALHVIERFKRTSIGHMDLIVTIDDPKAFVKPWTNTIPLTLVPDSELIEAFCDNQMLRLQHWDIPAMPPEPPSPNLPPLAGGK